MRVGILISMLFISSLFAGNVGASFLDDEAGISGYTKANTAIDLNPKTGDINGNGQLTLVDAIYLAKHVGGFKGYEVIYADGDINCDGKVTLVDAIYLAKHIGGFIGYEKLYCAALPPTATTLSATDITSTSAVLKGSINPNGWDTRYGFNWYDSTGAYLRSSPSMNIGSGTLPVDVSYTLTGLTPGTTYSYDISSYNSVGSGYGKHVTFTTLPQCCAPTATTLSATDITSTSAVLKGSINPNGWDTRYGFNWYDSTGAYLRSSPSMNIGSGTLPVDVSYTLTGLTPGTTYSYDISSYNSVGSGYGKHVTFTTLPS